MSPHQTASYRPAALIVATIALVSAGYALRHTVSCFLLSFVLAYLLDPLVVFLERRKVPRNYGIAVLYTFLAVFFFFFFTFFVPFISMRWDALVHGLPGYLQKLKQLTLTWKTRVAHPFITEEWHWLFDTVSGQLDKLFGKMGAGVYAAATKVVFNLLNLFLAPILVLFMLFYKKDILDGVVAWLPAGKRDAILDLGREIGTSVGGYIRGQLVVSAIVAVLSTVALFFLDIDYPLLNGLFAGLASILPFIGVILATIPALFFAYVKFQSGIVMFKVIAAFSVIYFLEGYVIKPLVFKEAMDLNPLITIIFVMALGEVMGFWGILLAIPIAAALKILSEHIHRGAFAGKNG